MGVTVVPPFYSYTDTDGKPVENGYIYIGEYGLNPLSSPQQAYWDSDLTIPAATVRTQGGYPVYNGSPGRLYTARTYSILVTNKNGSLIYSDLYGTGGSGGGGGGGGSSGLSVIPIATIAALRAYQPETSDMAVQVLGYYAEGDSGGGPIRYWDAASLATDNGGSVIRPTAVGVLEPGRWRWTESERISVKWFGAKGDGLADDQAAVQAAMTAFSDIYIPEGTYIMTTAMEYTKNMNIVGASSAAVLDFSAATISTTALKIKGSGLTALAALNADITMGTTTIVLSDVPAVAENDLILIFDSTSGSFHPGKTSWKAGEIARVRMIDAVTNTITVEHPFFDTYTNDGTVTVFKYNYSVVNLSNFKITGPGLLRNLVELEFTAYSKIRNITATGTSKTCVAISTCYDSEITGITTYDHTTAVGFNYGLSVSNSQKTLVTNCSLVATRHGLVTGGGADIGDIPVRDLIISNCKIGSLSAAGVNGFNTHGNAEFVTVTNCLLYNGMSLAGRKIIVQNNIIMSDTQGMCVYITDPLAPDINIINNYMYARTNVDASRGLIDYKYNVSYMGKGTTVIHGNTIEMSSYTGRAIYVYNTQTALDTDLVISNNVITSKFIRTAAGEAITSVEVKSLTGKNMKRVRIANNTLTNVALVVDGVNAELNEIVNNSIFNSPTFGIDVGRNSTPYWTSGDRTIIKGNVVIDSYTTGIIARGNSSATSVLVFEDNTIFNAARVPASSVIIDTAFYLRYAVLATCRNNTVGDLRAVTLMTTAYATENTVAALVLHDNEIMGTVTTRSLNHVAYAKNSVLEGSTTWDPVSFSGATQSKTLTVTGAAIGDYTSAAASIDLGGCFLCSYVSAANTVTLTLGNLTGAPIDLGSGTFYVCVTKRA